MSVPPQGGQQGVQLLLHIYAWRRMGFYNEKRVATWADDSSRGFFDMSISPKGSTPTEASAYFNGERDFDGLKAYDEEVANAKRYLHCYLTGETMEYPKPEVKVNEDQKLVEQFLADPNLVIKIIKGTYPSEDITHYARG